LIHFLSGAVPAGGFRELTGTKNINPRG